jgi:malonyl-CoA O-methyltransferase
MQRYPEAEVLALDLAVNMLCHARQRNADTARLSCVCADGERLPFADDSVDFIFSNLMLQWCMDLQPVFTELRASWSAADGFTHVNAFPDMHDVGDALLATRWAEPVMDVERVTVTYRELRTLMEELRHIGAHNVTAGRPRGLTGRHRFGRMAEAYEAYRREGVLPASYEVVYGHAWSPQNKDAVRHNLEVGLDGLVL